MKIFRWDSIQTPETQEALHKITKNYRGTALTIGGFDGPHRGHEALFEAVLNASSAMNLSPGIITFTQSPGAIKNRDHYPGNVSTLNLRLSAFSKRGFDFAVLIDFSDNFGRMVGGVFIDILVKTVRMKYLAVGPDFRCGHRLDTGAAEISARSRRDGFRFDSIRQIKQDGIRISSSAVRKAVLSADFSLAERLLGHPFLLDFNTPDWSVNEVYLEADRGSFTQIVPLTGTYSAKLFLLDKTVAVVRVLVTNEMVRLEPSEKTCLPAKETIAAIQFGLS
ncbi:MAG TPA: FAD synthetase family protein [Treponema sp.]|nr:FAD synthetase family protein [Treponema sp.]